MTDSRLIVQENNEVFDPFGVEMFIAGDERSPAAGPKLNESVLMGAHFPPVADDALDFSQLADTTSEDGIQSESYAVKDRLWIWQAAAVEDETPGIEPTQTITDFEAGDVASFAVPVSDDFVI